MGAIIVKKPAKKKKKKAMKDVPSKQTENCPSNKIQDLVYYRTPLEPTQCMSARFAPHYEKTKAEEPESHRPLSFLYNRTFSTKHTLAPNMVICTECMGAIYTSPSQTSI